MKHKGALWLKSFMKIVAQDQNQYVLRFDKDEEVIAGLGSFMSEQKITACGFTAIGSAGQLELGYYNKNLKEYRKKPFYEDLEIVSFMGNGGIMEGKPAIHGHGLFGRTDFTVIGGHVFKMVVTATCEMFVNKLNTTLNRAKNEQFNLNLLQ